MNIYYEKQTNMSIEDSIKIVKERLSEHSFGVLWEFDFKDKLTEKGIDFDESLIVMEVCNPNLAKEALNKNIRVGYFLPCKMAIYKKEGKTYIGMARPTKLIGLLQEDNLEDISNKVEKQLSKVIDESVKTD